MELLASAIRTLFYDFNVSSLYTDIKNHTNSFIKGDFVEQASWQARAFTKSGIIPGIAGICFELEDVDGWDELTAPIEWIFVYKC